MRTRWQAHGPAQIIAIGHKISSELSTAIDDCEDIKVTPAQLALLSHLSSYAEFLSKSHYTELELQLALDENRLRKLTRRVAQEEVTA
jgi:hypothetical protein